MGKDDTTPMSSVCNMNPTINGVSGAVYAAVGNTLLRLTRERLLSGELPENLEIVYGVEGHLRITDISPTSNSGAKIGGRTTVSEARLSLGGSGKSSPVAADITRLASAYEFKPTKKQAKQYSYVKDANKGSMEPMTYTVSETERTITTETKDGVETVNTAEVGDIIMSGPSGETYVVKKSKFEKLYDGEVGSTVIPNQDPRMVAHYTGVNDVIFKAPWGEDMVLKSGDYMVSDPGGGYYRIAKAEYEETYNQPGN